MNRNWKVRVAQPHDDLGEDTFHEWITLDERVQANCNGIPNPRMSFSAWTKWLCNNPDCSAWALVPDDAIARLVEESDG